MGAVWRAHDADLDREVAVKELHVPEQIADDERSVWFARMDREARAAARLRHPGIVTVYDRVRGDDGRPWIVMELVHGRSLDRVLAEEGPLPARRVAAIGLAMLDALSAAHAQGIVHRDVKPANVLLEGERVLLTDFGIAAMEGDATLTRSGAVLGTPAYMSPEQVEGRPVTPASDLWSLGAALYAAVEGRPPFTAPTHGALFVAIATRDPAPPRCGGPLAEALVKLLNRDPSERPSPARVRALLGAAAGGGPTRTDPVPGPAGRVSEQVATAADGVRARKGSVRGALACTWITVAVTLYTSRSQDVFVPYWAPYLLTGLVGSALLLSFGLWRPAPRRAILATVAVINVGLTSGALVGGYWRDDIMQVAIPSAVAWVGGAVALMFAFSAANPLLTARISPAGSRRGVLMLIAVAEGVVMTAWPWALFGALGMEVHLPVDGKGISLFVGPLGFVFVAWIASRFFGARH
ncbi:serine/threonine protein kinase [Actinomadura sp. WMMB 499]|nr:serine/threonine protein kinase [Actinomadura sp. WMMB 499]